MTDFIEAVITLVVMVPFLALAGLGYFGVLSIFNKGLFKDD